MSIEAAVERTTVSMSLDDAVNAVDNSTLDADDEHDAVVKAMEVAAKQLERTKQVFSLP